MKNYSTQIVAGMMALGLVFGSALAAPQIGQQAPDFTGIISKGGNVSLDDFAGKKVVLEWSNHDCPFVKKHYGSGNMQALQKRSTGDGTVWITIISSAPGQQGHVDAAQALALTKDRKAGPSYVILDESGAIGRLYGAKTTPHMYVLDTSHKLQYIGAIDSVPSSKQADIARADNYVAAALKSLRAGEPVVSKQSQPYGCAVKYGA